MSKYGEPWKEGTYAIYPIDNEGRTCATDGCMDRAIACVNAMAGVEDPAAAIRAAREAMEKSAEQFDYIVNMLGPETEPYPNMLSECASRIAELRAAIALLPQSEPAVK